MGVALVKPRGRRNLCAKACGAAGETISAALEDIIARVKKAGVADPGLFFEPESSAIFVMDRSHPGYVNSDRCGAAERQAAIVAEIPIRRIRSFDAGAW